MTPYHLPKKRGALKSTPKVSLFLETQFSQSLTPPSPSSPPPPLVFCWPHPHPHISSIKKQNNKGHTFYFCSQTIHLQDQTERESRRVLKPKEETALEREREREIIFVLHRYSASITTVLIPTASDMQPWWVKSVFWFHYFYEKDYVLWFKWGKFGK